ncbi:16S rRNA (uracil(1498)-N(3))-methyltransferase [Enterococcus asini]|uniref:16S rRNA (uracil(1498)-N(3))-methyltransferase n=1 Tax=Enterococcus asini TaxID=57732 RepID=UPI00288CE56A|nr:16S rRNA (uracil(1498)-N(3))-methyltransferase [Enterococcus asini]MDT2783721.1 16S rRNA (uracil(1498)-N(3))-methyltransferase [Enterococcus asini]
MQRYFIDLPYTGGSYELAGEVFHHIVRVMRMEPGEEVYLVFPDQMAIIAKITEIKPETVVLVEVAKEEQAKELPIFVTIASGYPKGDKLEWIVQKGTELGAAAFMGFPARASVVKWDAKKLGKKQQRLEKIAQEAAEQSQRQRTPKIQLLGQFSELMAALPEYDRILIAYEESAKAGEMAHLAQVLTEVQPGERILAVFGPEGGIMPAEIEALVAAGGILCSLGPRILRTETAPLYLLSAASYQLELAKE